MKSTWNSPACVVLARYRANDVEGAAEASNNLETMPKKVYDHHKKAGNQGDVIKHIALIAALDTVLEKHRGTVFSYADIFAGYARNPLVRGNEWRHGIGKLSGRQDLDNNEHTALYKRWYLTRPQLLGGTYPGSCLIAADMGAWKKRKIHLCLWDTSPSVLADLNKVFIGQGHRIVGQAASPNQREAKYSDFLLIDPPDGTKQTWDFICDFLANGNSAVLIWLPVNANTTNRPPNEHKQSELSRNAALTVGCQVTKVRWSAGGRMIGCQLVYRLPIEAKRVLRKAVGHVSSILAWDCEHYDEPAQ